MIAYGQWLMACPYVKASHRPWAISHSTTSEIRNNRVNKQIKPNNTMKKQLLTIAIVLGLGLTTSFAQGGLFQRGDVPTEEQGNRDGGPGLPGHGASGHQDAPLGSGIAVLAALGGAYLIGKRRKQN